MSVPAFSELGATARNVFRATFGLDRGTFKWTQQYEQMNFEAGVVTDLRSQKLGGSIGAKYTTENVGAYSVKFTGPEGPIVAEFNKGGIYDNFDVAAGYSFNTEDHFQTLSFKGKYHNSSMHGALLITKDFDRSLDLIGSVVGRIQNFLVGYEVGFDTNTSKVTKNDVALAFEQSNLGLHLRCIQIPHEFGLSIFYRVNEEFNVAVDSKIANNNDKMWFAGVGMQYKVDESSTLRMKFDKNLQLGTSLQLRPQDHVALTLSINLDLTNPTGGGHKIGFAVEIQA